MAEIEYSGIKIKGGKILIILSLLGTLGGAAWTGFTFYQDYLDMKAKIQEYTAPDLSSYDEKLAVLKSEIDSILDEITLVSDVAKDLKNDMKTDLRSMANDIRHITEIVNDVEDRQKEDTREIFDELKIIENELNLSINKALNNPLNNMSATK
jgi:MinD-like ATPase involved in chromosome partitioning or flagellar assembly